MKKQNRTDNGTFSRIKLFYVLILMFAVLLLIGCDVNKNSSLNDSNDDLSEADDIDKADNGNVIDREGNDIDNNIDGSIGIGSDDNNEIGNSENDVENNINDNIKTKIDFLSIKNCTGDNESFSAEINGNDVVISHKIKYMCSALLDVNAETEGGVLKIYYDNVGELDRCRCVFDINLKVNVQDKVDKVEVYGFKYVDPITDLMVTSYDLLDKYPEDVSEKSLIECRTDADCVPDSCCHPRGCVLKSEKPVCEGVICTLECKGGTLDCGQGSCACVNGKCAVEWKNEIKI